MLSRDFKEFVELLNAGGVEYSVVGGYALAAMTTIDGVEFGASWPRRLVVEIAGIQLPLIGLEDFKANKRATGRHKDLADLDSLDDLGAKE